MSPQPPAPLLKTYQWLPSHEEQNPVGPLHAASRPPVQLSPAEPAAPLPGMHFPDVHMALSKPRPGHLLSEAFSNMALSTSPCALPCLLFLHSTAMHYQGRPRAEMSPSSHKSVHCLGQGCGTAVALRRAQDNA